VPSRAGVMVYGQTREAALAGVEAHALRVLADRPTPDDHSSRAGRHSAGSAAVPAAPVRPHPPPKKPGHLVRPTPSLLEGQKATLSS